MKFRDAAKAYFNNPNMSDQQLLSAMRVSDHGTRTRFFDKIGVLPLGPTEPNIAAQQVFSTALLKNKSNPTAYDIYKAIATGEKSKVFAAFKAVEQQLAEFPDWKEFWAGKDTPENLPLKQTLINAYRFTIIQNLYSAAMGVNPKDTMFHMEKFQKLSDEYQNNKSTNTDDTPDDPIIKDLDAYIARKSKPSTLTLKRVKTLSRTLSMSTPPEITHMYAQGDGEKVKIARDLKALLEAKDEPRKTEKLEALQARYNKIKENFGSTTLGDCLAAAKKRLPDDSTHMSI